MRSHRFDVFQNTACSFPAAKTAASTFGTFQLSSWFGFWEFTAAKLPTWKHVGLQATFSSLLRDKFQFIQSTAIHLVDFFSYFGIWFDSFRICSNRKSVVHWRPSWSRMGAPADGAFGSFWRVHPRLGTRACSLSQLQVRDVNSPFHLHPWVGWKIFTQASLLGDFRCNADFENFRWVGWGEKSSPNFHLRP